MALKNRKRITTLDDIISASVKSPKQKIAARFRHNLDRVQNLQTIAADLDEDDQGDILRSAVVLLHATLEDVLRGVEGIYLRTDDLSLDVLDTIPAAYDDDGKPIGKIGLGRLKALAGQDVAAVVNERISQHLNRQSYNNRDAVLAVAKKFNAPMKDVGTLCATVDLVMKRRHHIVHQSDREGVTDTCHGKPKTITSSEVKQREEAAIALATIILRSVPDRGSAAEQQRQKKATEELLAAGSTAADAT